MIFKCLCFICVAPSALWLKCSMVEIGNLELNLVLSQLFTLFQTDQKLERSRNVGFTVYFLVKKSPDFSKN